MGRLKLIDGESELKKQGLVDSSGSEESSSSEEEEEPRKIVDSKFFVALNKVKNQDPSLKDTDAKLFDSDSDEEDDISNEDEKEKKENKKPMHLKDVVAKHLIEEGPEFDDEETDDEMGNGVKTYSEEQEDLRRGFLKATSEEEEKNDDEEDLFKVKNAGSLDGEEEGEADIKELETFFGPDEELDENSKFLKDFFRNRMWIDDERSKGEGDGEIEFSEDEVEIERQEDYEREYNFRSEENVGDRVMGHSRIVEGSVRKKDNARKLQRERKSERLAQAEFERREELKRLKNLKKKEIKEKLEKIRRVAGIGHDKNIALDEDDLKEEFNPEEHDRKMKEAFGNNYYEAEDADPGFGSGDDEFELEKPDFDKEDELLGLPKGWDLADKSGDGDESEDGDQDPKEGKQKGKQRVSEVEKVAREELMEKYYELDYEDTIGDLKTKFKYKKVKPRRYGLSPAEILMVDDKDLNQYISLKKMAPYREQDWKVPRVKTLSFIKTVLRRRKINRNPKTILSKNEKKKQYEPKPTTEADGAEETERLNHTELDADEGTSSKKNKRKRQAEFYLSDSRLKAYGKAPAKSKRTKT